VFYFLIVIAVVLLVYAGILVSFVRSGRKIPSAAYLGLAALNGLILAAVLAWAIARR
jgi:Na+-translocating ferredoxin:NAD+ oxidoreductase RnfA subunit